MALEALIRVRQEASFHKRSGDVICIKLKEHADWGKEEVKFHQAVPWFDEKLESKMRREWLETGIFPVAVTPYKIDEKFYLKYRKKTYEKSILKTRSYKYFDINELTEEIRQNIISDNVVEDLNHIDLDKIKTCIKTKTEEEISLEFEKNKKMALGEI